MFVPFIWCFSADIFYLFYFLHNTWLVPFCIFLTRYSCLLVIRSESYKQSEARCVCGGGGVFPPSLPETLIDLKFCCFFFFLQLSLLMLTFRRFYTKIHIFLFVFFLHPAQISSPAFPSLFSPPTLHFTHGSCRWFSLTASLGLIICIQINYLITDKCPAATPHSGSSALSL